MASNGVAIPRYTASRRSSNPLARSFRRSSKSSESGQNKNKSALFDSKIQLKDAISISKVTRHTDRIIASKTKNQLSKFSQSNFSELEFRGFKSHSRCSNLFSKFGMQLRGKSSDLDQDESILADRRLTPRNPVESVSVRESYGSNYAKT